MRYRIDLTMIATYELEIETDAEPETDDFQDAIDNAWLVHPYADMETSEITTDRVVVEAAVA